MRSTLLLLVSLRAGFDELTHVSDLSFDHFGFGQAWRGQGRIAYRFAALRSLRFFEGVPCGWILECAGCVCKWWCFSIGFTGWTGYAPRWYFWITCFCSLYQHKFEIVKSTFIIFDNNN